MKIAIISDVHANLPALEAVLKDLDRLRAEAIYCLGDLVGYCSYPKETIDLLRHRGVTSIQGNHDLIAIGELDPAGLGPNGRKAIAWTTEVLGPDEKGFLSSLPGHLVVEREVLLLHSRLDDPVTHNRGLKGHVEAWAQVRSRFPEVRIVFSGHTHQSGAFRITKSGHPSRVQRRKFDLEENHYYVINPGSVGHPRWEDYRASYLIFDTTAYRIEFRKVRYPRHRVDEANRQVGISTDLGPSIPQYYFRLAAARLRSMKLRLSNIL